MEWRSEPPSTVVVGEWSRIWIAAGFGAITLLAVGLLLLKGTRNNLPAAPPAIEATVVRGMASEVAPQSQPPTFIGVLLPYESVDLTAKADGHIEAIPVRVGEFVARGAIVATLDVAILARADLDMAEAELRSAQAESSRLSIELTRARERLGRSASLNELNLLSGEQLSDRRYEEQLALARVTSAQSAIDQKRAFLAQRTTLLSNAVVRTPFDAVVATRYVDRGSNVSRGTPIVRLIRTNPLKVRFAVPASLSQLCRAGMAISAYIKDLGVTIRGTVEAVSPEIDPASQMLIVEGILATSAIGEVKLPDALAGRIATITLLSPSESLSNSVPVRRSTRR
jgi:RND family efflux transporter MFP subunit